MVTKIGGLMLHIWVELFSFDTKSYICMVDINIEYIGH